MGDDFYERAQKMRNRLNAVSPSFCLAKWTQVSLHLPTGRTHSCYHPPSHQVPLDELNLDPGALHNTKFKKQQRKKMLDGVRPAECAYCWKVEDLGSQHLSDRHYRSTEDWAAERFEEVQNSPWDVDIYPSYLEVNFNHACQLKCSYCSPQLSSAWMAEVRQLGHYPTTWGHNRLEWLESENLIPIPPDQPNPWVDAFWKWWPDVYPHLRVFRMTGGEPLIDPNTFRVFDYVKKNPNPQLQLSLTSNMCPPQSSFDRFLNDAKEMISKQSIQNFFLFASIDSTGAQAEYIRHGLKFEAFVKNVETYLTEIPTAQISFIMTFSNLAAVGLDRYLRFVMDLRKKFSKNEQRVHLDTPFLRSPEFLSLQILDEPNKKALAKMVEKAKSQYLQQDLRDFSKLSHTEIAKLTRVLEWAQLQVPDPVALSRHRADFLMFFQEHDRRRQTDFFRTFPELLEFWELCNIEYQKSPASSVKT